MDLRWRVHETRPYEGGRVADELFNFIAGNMLGHSRAASGRVSREPRPGGLRMRGRGVGGTTFGELREHADEFSVVEFIHSETDERVSSVRAMHMGTKEGKQADTYISLLRLATRFSKSGWGTPIPYTILYRLKTINAAAA